MCCMHDLVFIHVGVCNVCGVCACGVCGVCGVCGSQFDTL